MQVIDTLTLNGTVSANGGNGTVDDAGGAGGSIYAALGTITGAGAFSANGGNVAVGINSGGGGGGRIAVYIQSGLLEDPASSTANGGAGLNPGQSGTVLFNPRVLEVQKIGTGSGTVTPVPAGLSCGTDCYYYTTAQTVSLTASPSAGSTFTGWFRRRVYRHRQLHRDYG